MPNVSIIGAGKMGTAIARIAIKSGASVQILAPNLEHATATAADVGATASAVGDVLTGDIVILAVPYSAVSEIEKRIPAMPASFMRSTVSLSSWRHSK